MRETTIVIPYDADKLDAIRKFQPPDKPGLEDVILAIINKIYVQNVPKQVRFFIETPSTTVESAPRRREKPRENNGDDA